MPPNDLLQRARIKDYAAVLVAAYKQALDGRSPADGVDEDVLAHDVAVAVAAAGDGVITFNPVDDAAVQAQMRKIWGRGEDLPRFDFHAVRKARAEKALAEAQRLIDSDASRAVLGAPRGPAKPVLALGKRKPGAPAPPRDAFIQSFEFGHISIPRDISVPLPCTYYAADIFVAAVKCFGTDDPGGPFSKGEDEPYITMTLINPAPAACGATTGIAQSWASPVFQEIEGGDIFCQEEQAFSDVVIGRHGIAIKIAVVDQEHGSREAVRAELQKQAQRAENTLKDAAETLIGVDADQAVQQQQLEDNLLDTLGDITLGGLTDLLSDDLIDEKLWRIPARKMVDWVQQNTLATSDVQYPSSELPAHIRTNFPYEDLFARERLFSGGGGSYKVYLRIMPYENRQVWSRQ